jgi:guanylate kinase
MNFMDNRIIVLCGYQGSGKDYLASELKKRGYDFIISHTTRPMRPNENEENPYYFTTKEKFLEMIENDEFLEYRTYNTLVDNIPDVWYYGVNKKAVKENKSYVVVLDKLGLIEFKKEFKDRVVSFYIDASDKNRYDRANSRGGFNSQEWERRELADKKEFEGIFDIVDGVIDNNDNKLNTLKSLLFRISMKEDDVCD